MKIRHLIYIGIIASLFATGCDSLQVGDSFLEKAPSSDVTIDTIFSSLEYAQRELWGAYATLPYGLNLDWSAKGNKLGMDILEVCVAADHSMFKSKFFHFIPIVVPMLYSG